MPDGNYFEVISTDEQGNADGRLQAIKMRSGFLHLAIEEWVVGEPDPVDSEVGEAVIILDAEQGRKFGAWIREVMG